MRAASSQQKDSVRPPDIKKLSIRKNQEDDFYEDTECTTQPEEPEHDDGYGYANDTVEDYSETYPTEYYRQDFSQAFNRQDVYDSPGSPRGSREHQSHPSQVRQRSIDQRIDPRQQREPVKPNIPKQAQPRQSGQSGQSRQQSRQSQAPLDRAGIWGLNPRQNRNGA
jgi:hypothetical protein